MACFGLTRRSHWHHQKTCHSISVANGDTHLRFADSMSSSWALAGSPTAPVVLLCCTIAKSHKWWVLWVLSAHSLGILWDPFVHRQCWNNFSYCGQYQWLYRSPETKPQGFRLTCATELVCTMNVCTTHIHQRSELKGPWRLLKHSPPHTDIWLLVLIPILLG